MRQPHLRPINTRSAGPESNMGAEAGWLPWRRGSTHRWIIAGEVSESVPNSTQRAPTANTGRGGDLSGNSQVSSAVLFSCVTLCNVKVYVRGGAALDLHQREEPSAADPLKLGSSCRSCLKTFK